MSIRTVIEINHDLNRGQQSTIQLRQPVSLYLYAIRQIAQGFRRRTPKPSDSDLKTRPNHRPEPVSVAHQFNVFSRGDFRDGQANISSDFYHHSSSSPW
jgi:hypothetical protein